MRLRFLAVLCLLFAATFPAVCLLGAVPARAAIDTSAEHGLLMDATTGQVLWQKDGLTPMPPASMSKLMNLELLPETGAIVIAAPLKIVNGSGSPLRVIAITP